MGAGVAAVTATAGLCVAATAALPAGEAAGVAAAERVREPGRAWPLGVAAGSLRPTTTASGRSAVPGNAGRWPDPPATNPAATTPTAIASTTLVPAPRTTNHRRRIPVLSTNTGCGLGITGPANGPSSPLAI